MSIEAKRQERLHEAKELLKALGLKKAQCNNRSAWVFLALANVKPADKWCSATAPLLPTVTIMEFIRDEYGMDYRPNTRETIRRQTLHQFEQARIVDRNRDFTARPTNSKDNNYSLNQPILEILSAYPDGEWRMKIQEYKESIPEISAEYARKLEQDRIPVILPNGKTIKLSPGEHNQLHADIAHEFCPRFIGRDCVVLYIGDTASSRDEGGKLMVQETEILQSLGIQPMSHDKLPDIIAYDKNRQWLFLLEAVTSHGPISPKRRTELRQAFKGCTIEIIYVTAFPNHAEFRKNAANIAWETEVWIADHPNHMIHFNGDRFLAAHPEGK